MINKFHLEYLSELLADDSKYGYIIIDGNGILIATLSGSTKNILHNIFIDIIFCIKKLQRLLHEYIRIYQK